MCEVDKTHLLEDRNAIQGRQDRRAVVWAVSVLGFTFPLPLCLSVGGLCRRQETLWVLSVKK